MFNFMKKAGTGVSNDKDEKERRKRDKKDRKEKQKRDRASMSTEELLRLDEVKIWFFITLYNVVNIMWRFFLLTMKYVKRMNA